jgi:hypothetical protein
MTDITDRLRARRVTNWIHSTGETPVAAGLAHDTLCCLAADEIERLRNDLHSCGPTCTRAGCVAAGLRLRVKALESAITESLCMAGNWPEGAQAVLEDALLL